MQPKLERVSTFGGTHIILTDILNYYKVLNAEFGMDSLNMSEISQRFINSKSRHENDKYKLL